MLNTEEESVMKASSREEGRIIAQSRFDVNDEFPSIETATVRVKTRTSGNHESFYANNECEGESALLAG